MGPRDTGLFGTKSHFVPLVGPSPTGEDVTVDVTKDQVKDAPSIDGDGELSQDEERRLFEHYGVPYTDEGSVTAEGTAGDGAAPLAEATGESGMAAPAGRLTRPAATRAARRPTMR